MHPALRPLVCTSIAVLAGIVVSCTDDSGSLVPPEPEVQARLLVDDTSSDEIVIRLDSSKLAGVPVTSELQVVSHPWNPDTIRVADRTGFWSIDSAPDGPFAVKATLRDDQGRVRAIGTHAFLRARPVTLCSHPMTIGEWVGLLGGNLVIVAGLDNAARSGRDVVQAILAAMTLGPVDFDRLGALQTRFSNGVYSYGTDPSRVETRFAFVAAQAFGTYATGDTLRENVANVSSYLQNLKFSLTNGVTWNRGPLFDLIQGSVSVSRNLDASFSIDPSRLSVTLATRVQANRSRRTVSIRHDSLVFVEATPDSLGLRISLPAMTIGRLKSALSDGTLLFSHDGTTYASQVDGIRQSFHDSRIQLYDDTLGVAQFRGSYQADASSGGLNYHHLGIISSNSPQSTTFACDEAFRDTLGVAHHGAELTHGRFVTASHDTIPYALVPY